MFKTNKGKPYFLWCIFAGIEINTIIYAVIIVIGYTGVKITYRRESWFSRPERNLFLKNACQKALTHLNLTSVIS